MEASSEFTNGEMELAIAHSIFLRYPSFTFGGKQGQAISTVCFRRKIDDIA